MNHRFDKHITNSFYRGMFVFVVLVALYGIFRLVTGYKQLTDRVDALQAQVDLLLRDSLRFSSVIPQYSIDDYQDEHSHIPSTERHSSNNLSASSLSKSETKDASLSVSNHIQHEIADNNARSSSSSPVSEVSSDQVIKFTTPHLFDLNTIDSLTLIRIPGIAGRTASIIINYRNKLGGFYVSKQLEECLTWDAAREKLSMWCDNWFCADTARIRLLPINKLSFKALLNHPYLNYNQVKDIVNYRSRRAFVQISDFNQLDSFSDSDIERLSHYVSFEL